MEIPQPLLLLCVLSLSACAAPVTPRSSDSSVLSSRLTSRLRRLVIVAGLALAFAPLQAAAPTDAPAWKAGAAAIDITPEGPVWMSGYGFRNKPSEGVAQRIFAKALALDDAAGTPMVFVTLDLISVPRVVRESVERTVAARHHLPPASLLINASHTHSGPAPYARGVPDPVYARKGEEYGRMLEQKIVEVIATALARREPSHLHYTHARAGFAMNRRLPVGKEFRNSPNPDGPVDHDVPVLRVTGGDGKLRALLFGYACHNTVTGFYKINGDYAGYAQAELEAARPGVVALFMIGAGGDQNPYPRSVSLEQSAQHGRALAYAVEAALAVTTPRPVRGPLRSAYGFAELEYAEVTRPALERRVQSSRGVEKDNALALLKKLDAGESLPKGYPCPVQVVKFGNDLTLIAIGGETTVDYSLRLKQELASARIPIWVAGYSNDGFGYLGSRRVILEGGYEGYSANLGRHPGPWAPDSEDRVIAKAHQLLRSLEAP